MNLDWKSIQKPIIALAPMADMTDMPFCRIVKEVTNSSDITDSNCEKENGNSYPIVFREMVSSEATVRDNEKTLQMTEIHKDERPLVQQLFGANPEVMRDAAGIIQEKYSPDGFDINMGCPVYKITSNFNGAALMKDVENASEIVKQMKSVLKVPLSVKIRAGWSDHNESLIFAPKMEEAGVDLITIHGRTKTQGYSGNSDWELIAEVKKKVSIPLLANGDINSPEKVKEALDITNADGVLIARGALGNPWIFKQAKSYLETGEYANPPIEERMEVILKHLDYHLDHYGLEYSRTFRKHLTWYFKGIHGIKIYKERLHTFENKEDLIKIFDEIKSDDKVFI